MKLFIAFFLASLASSQQIKTKGAIQRKLRAGDKARGQGMGRVRNGPVNTLLSYPGITFEHWGWNICGGMGDDGDGVPMGEFAFYDPGCSSQAEGVPDNFIFLAGGADGIDERTCSYPKTEHILLPVVNCLEIPSEEDCDAHEWEDCFELTEPCDPGIVDYATLDGKPVKVVEVIELGLLTGSCSRFETWGVEGAPTRAAGKWIELTDLPVGDHLIAISGSNPQHDFHTHVTFKLTITE